MYRVLNRLVFPLQLLPIFPLVVAVVVGLREDQLGFRRLDPVQVAVNTHGYWVGVVVVPVVVVVGPVDQAVKIRIDASHARQLSICLLRIWPLLHRPWVCPSRAMVAMPSWWPKVTL